MFGEEWALFTGKCPLEMGLNLQKEAALMQQVIILFIYRCNLPRTSRKVHRPLKYLTIIPGARMGSESIAHEAEGRMGY